MRHESLNEMHATPIHPKRTATAAEVAKALRGQFQPAAQAHADALRHDDDPIPHAMHFADGVGRAAEDQRSRIRTDVLDLFAQNERAAGALVVTVEPAEVASVVENSGIDLAQIALEKEPDNDKAIAAVRHERTESRAWCERSGGKLRKKPLNSTASTVAFIATFFLVETWGVAQFMEAQPVEGEISPYIRGLCFAVASVAWGILGAYGSALAADKRIVRQRSGIGLVVLALLLWFLTALCAAHMRAVIEAGGLGTAFEIWHSMQSGLFWPFVSPASIILAAASALTTAAAWMKWGGWLGKPLGGREVHEKLVWAEDQARIAENAHKTAAKRLIAAKKQSVAGFVAAGWAPANDGQRLYRETCLMLAQARECFSAVVRIAESLVADYASAIRKLRPGVDVSNAVQLLPPADDALPDPERIQERVTQLTLSAQAVDAAGRIAETALRNLELQHLRQIEERFGLTRHGTATGVGTLLPRNNP